MTPRVVLARCLVPKMVKKVCALSQLPSIRSYVSGRHTIHNSEACSRYPFNYMQIIISNILEIKNTWVLRFFEALGALHKLKNVKKNE